MFARTSRRLLSVRLGIIVLTSALLVFVVLALLGGVGGAANVAAREEERILPHVSAPLRSAAGTIQSLVTGDADLILEGSQFDERFGIHGLDAAGDVNGDGYPDLIIGSDDYNVPGSGYTDEGAAFVYYGSATGVISTPVVTLTVAQSYANFGVNVAGLGDVNADGYADVAVGASNYDTLVGDEGAVFVYYGSASGISATPSLTLTGAASGFLLGGGVAAAGDVNADGYADLIAAAQGYDNGEENEGAAFVYHGSAAGLSATPAVTIENNISSTILNGVAGVGDVNADGYADVIVGSTQYNANDGIAYVHHGSTTGISASPAVTLVTAPVDDQFGIVGYGGDVNGDGYADVVVGAQRYTNGQSGEGAFFVYHGSASGIGATPAITVESNAAGSYLGNSVGWVGDADGDGYGDVLVGARVYDLPYGDAGAAFLYHGSADGLDVANPIWLSGVQGQQYGYQVSRAGDVNGDGLADILVAQDYYHTPETRAGAVYVYHGGGSPLSATPAWTTVGENAGDSYSRIAPAGDVNGDGLADVIVGANGYMTSTGRVYLFLGETGGLPTTPTLVLTGREEGERFGLRLASTGDVNGDGYADVLVAATGYMTNTGRVYLFLGVPGGLNPTPALTLTGELEGDGFGRVAPAGDVNGDGFADAIFGTSSYPGGTSRGKIYLHYGSPTGLRAPPAFTATGEAAGDSFGRSLGTAGDVNGDGYADVIVGASSYGGASNYGRIYVYYGSPTGLDATRMISVTGAGTNYRLGGAVSTAGDVNGDGFADVIAGADYANSQSGLVYVFQGSATGTITTPIFAEGDASPHFGRAVGTAGDLNGDGYDDIVVGTSTYPGFGTRRGRILVYLGAANGPDGAPDFIQNGENAYDWFGHHVGTAGDVDGDNFPDLLVGAPNYPNNGLQGKAYLFTTGLGRDVAAGQLRGDTGGLPVQTWGLSHAPDGFQVNMMATHPRGRELVRLQVEACPAGTPFGDVTCATYTQPTWSEVLPGATSVPFEETLSGLAGDTVYRWWARVEYDSLVNPHGPWRRYRASWLEADLRVGTPPDVAVNKSVTPPVVGPGQAVTYTLAFSNAGSLAAPDVSIVDAVPLTLTNLSYSSSRPVTPSGTFSYTWLVGDLASGEGGVITIAGTVDPAVSGVFSLTNEALITTTAEDGDLGNNSDTASNSVDTEAPQAPSLLSPHDGARINDVTPALEWVASAGAAGYLLDFNGSVMDLGDVTSYTTGVLADGTYTWTVAAYDSVGNTGTYTDVWSFEIDSVAPAILGVVPNADAVEVELETVVVITFSKSIDVGTFAYSVTPDPGGWNATWNPMETQVTLTHADFDASTTYTFTVTAADDTVGNALVGAPYAWQFTTVDYAIYLPLVLRQ